MSLRLTDTYHYIQINNKDLLYSTGNNIQYLAITYKGKKLKKNVYVCAYIYIHIWKVKTLFAQSCPALCDPMDCSLPGTSVHGILQARTKNSGVGCHSLL